MKITDMEYNAIMGAIELFKVAIDEDEAIDPYNNDEGITNEQLNEAIYSIEDKLQKIFFSK